MRNISGDTLFYPGTLQCTAVSAGIKNRLAAVQALSSKMLCTCAGCCPPPSQDAPTCFFPILEPDPITSAVQPPSFLGDGSEDAPPASGPKEEESPDSGSELEPADSHQEASSSSSYSSTTRSRTTKTVTRRRRRKSTT